MNGATDNAGIIRSASSEQRARVRVRRARARARALGRRSTALRIEGTKPVGTYAYTVAFSDGHDTGIFFFELLRDNIRSMARVGFYNLPLVKYLVRQGTQSMTGRLKVLRDFYPDARPDGW